MISFIIPSRGRPGELLTSLNTLELARNGLEALVWLDDDDPKLLEYQKLFANNPNVRLFVKNRVGYKGFHLMLDFLASNAKYDWIFEWNDDAIMNNVMWFDIFKDFVRQFEPSNQPVVINFWGQGEIIFNLFPIVSRTYLNVLGHFSLIPACDDWVRMVGMGAKISYDLKGIKPTHHKYGADKALKDETFYEVEAARSEAKKSMDPRHSPFRQLLKQDIGRIVEYNASIESCQNSLRIKTVGFIGLGKLGKPIAEAVQARGFNVLGFDVKPVETTLPLAASITELVEKSDIVFCAVQTPHGPLYEGDKPLPSTRADFDYSYLTNVVKQIVATGKKTNLVVISTCLPGTFREKIKPLLTKEINYLYNPFFIAMGTVVEDFLNPEFVLIGGEDTAILKYFYTKFYGQDKTLVTDITTAEGIKVFYNTFVTTKTVLGNMYGEFAHKFDMNTDDIYEALSRSTDRLISPKYLKSGMGDGGSCHPRDNIALSHLAEKAGMSFNYFDALMEAREKHTHWLADLFIKQIKASSLPGIILGKSFKPGVEMQAGSPAILLAHFVKKKGVKFHHFEFDIPEVLPQAVYFIATMHETYKDLQYPLGSVIIDPFRYIPQKDGVEIIAIGGKKKMDTLDYIGKKFNLKSPGPGTNIPGSREVELLTIFKDLGFTKGVEIGVERGVFSEKICQANPQLTLYCVDPWKAYKGYRDHVSQEKLDLFYKETSERLSNYNCKIIRGFSEEVYKQFPDESLDFVYIDANHDFLHVTQDIYYWMTKIRKGGIVAGHDFRRDKGNYINHIKDVIPAITYALKINPWFILRSPDETSSWFWVKP